jgi:hypothetical protein
MTGIQYRQFIFLFSSPLFLIYWTYSVPLSSLFTRTHSSTRSHATIQLEEKFMQTWGGLTNGNPHQKNEIKG